MTDKQKKVISFIESNLGITFTGQSVEEARLFISTNMEASKARKFSNEVTPKQKAACSAICELLKLDSFCPKDKRHAQEFISKHIVDARTTLRLRIEGPRQPVSQFRADVLPSDKYQYQVQHLQDKMHYGDQVADALYFDSLWGDW